MDMQQERTALVVYFSLTKQSARVAEAITHALDARGFTAVPAGIEFTDRRWAPKLSQFPMKHPMPSIGSILTAQLRHKTGEIVIPSTAQSGDYDLIVVISPTWWFQTSMPIRSYLETAAAKSVLHGKSFACVSVSRRYFSVNLRQQRKLGEQLGGQWVDSSHFVVAGGQVKSMLSWLGYMKHGKPQARVFGLAMPPPNLQADFPQQSEDFVGAVIARAFPEADPGRQ
jgi:flavodoxin